MATKTVSTDTPATIIVERGSSGGIAAGLIVLAIVLIGLAVAYFMFSADRGDHVRTDAISSASASVAGSASQAANSGSGAAGAMTPKAPAPQQ